MSLSDQELIDICRNLHLSCRGVFCKDELIEEEPLEGAYYINMQDENDGNGTHWVLCIIFPKGKALYFDSFGCPYPTEIKSFLKEFQPVPINNRQIQGITSQMCGFFCIACNYFFTYDASPKKGFLTNYEDFLSMWSPNPDENDKRLKQYLKGKTIQFNN